MAKIETLFDDFNDNSRDVTKWTQFNASTSETNHELELVCASSSTLYHGYDSVNLYDLTGSFAKTQVVNAGNQALASLEVFPVNLFDSGNVDSVFWYINGGFIQAYKRVSSTNTSLASTSYNSSVHKWFRIRESAGTIYYDYSTDGLAWTNFATLPTSTLTITSLQLELSAGTYSSEASSTTVIFDNFNTGIQTATVETLDGTSDISVAARYIGNGLATFAGDSVFNAATPTVLAGDSDITVSANYTPINVYGTPPTSFSILINNVDRTGDVVAGSLSIDDLLYDQANVAAFNMEILSGLAAPYTDQEVAVWLDGVLQFGGLIDSVKSVRAGGQFDVWQIGCVDYTRLLDRRLVNQTFNNMLDTDIVNAIITGYASDEAITTNNVTTAGILVSQISWNYISPSQALSDLAKLTGRFWYIDYAKDLHYFPLTQNQAQFDITDNANMFTNLQTAKDVSQLRNRIFVQGGTQLSDPFTESQKADGVKTTFLLAEKPHAITMTVNGTSKTIGIENIDDPTTVNFLVNYEEKYIKVGNAATPSNGDTLAFTYQYDVPVLVSIEDTASIAADGVFEFPIIDSTIATTDAARDRATAELTDYSQKLVTVQYDTMVRNLRSGMYQNVNLTPQNIAGDYIITEVKLQSISGGLFLTSVTLTSAKVLGIIKFLIDMLNITHTVGTFNPDATVDGFAGLSDSLNPLSDSLVDSLSAGNSSAKWSNDAGTTTFKLKWSLGQWQ